MFSLKKWLTPFILIMTQSIYAQTIIPEPVEMTVGKGTVFVIDGQTAIVASSTDELRSAAFLNNYLTTYYHFFLPITSKSNNLSVIRFVSKVWSNKKEFNKKGAYCLKINKKEITLQSSSPEGLFYAMQSLIQLLPMQTPLTLSETTVKDYPRFEYRGMHLDVVRHIFPVEFIKKYIDYLAFHKMNYFHWHLTDDQGWRIESKKYPALNTIGSWRDGTIIGLFPGTGVDSTRYGGYYTQEQIREIVKYAHDRYITIVPEIDIPGHSMAIIASMPQFSTTPELPKKVAITWGMYNRQNNVLAPSEAVFQFLSDVFNELMDLFPGNYIHLGADECAKKWWKESPETQEFMKQHSIADEEALQKYFIERVSDVIKSRGRKFIGWDDMYDSGLVDGAVVMAWRRNNKGAKAAQAGHNVIMAPINRVYFNVTQKEHDETLAHRDFIVTCDSTYHFEPAPQTLDAAAIQHIIGAEGCMWTEYFATEKAVEYGIFPRMSALSEVQWSLPQNKDWKKFRTKLNVQRKRYALWGANYCDDVFKNE